MKGLVFKDLLLMKKMNKKVIFVMYFFVIAISFFGENEVYSIRGCKNSCVYGK